MANLAFSQRIERATVGALRARWASHSRQSRLERSIYAVLIVWLGDFANRARTCCSLPWTTLRSTLITLRTLARLMNRGVIQIRINDPVSYTHLRAHETRHDLVCRL